MSDDTRRKQTDRVVRAAAVVLAGSLSLAALAFAWGQVNRTTAVAYDRWPVVVRENLVTDRVDFCIVGGDQQGSGCVRAERRPNPSRPYGVDEAAAPDFSDRAKSAPERG